MGGAKPKLVLVLHDVSSGSTLQSFVKTAVAYKDYVEVVVVSRASGAAAQFGVAEASKALYKEGLGLLVLPDLSDVFELLPGRKVVAFSRRFGSPVKEARELGISNGALALFSGSETGFSKSEIEALANALVVYPRGASKELPPESYLSVLMHMVAASSEA